MQKIQNLKQYTNSEIGIVRDAQTAEDTYQNLLVELKEVASAWKHAASEDSEGKEIRF